MKTTKKELQKLVNQIGELTGLATSHEEAKNKNLTSYLYLEYNSVYGGYCLVSVRLDNGGHFGALGMSSNETRLKALEMEIKLRGIIIGLTYKK